jgi:hypothetical protein
VIVGAFLIEKLHFLLFQNRPFHTLSRAEPVFIGSSCEKISQANPHKGRSLARRPMLKLQNAVRLIFVDKNHSFADLGG